jgi:hypothetical protein
MDIKYMLAYIFMSMGPAKHERLICRATHIIKL